MPDTKAAPRADTKLHESSAGDLNGQSYKGEVLHVDQEQGLCVQKIGRESLYVHKLDKLAEVPKVGDNVKIAYSKNPEEKASITLQETRHKGLRR